VRDPAWPECAVRSVARSVIYLLCELFVFVVFVAIFVVSTEKYTVALTLAERQTERC